MSIIDIAAQTVKNESSELSDDNARTIIMAGSKSVVSLVYANKRLKLISPLPT